MQIQVANPVGIFNNNSASVREESFLFVCVCIRKLVNRQRRNAGAEEDLKASAVSVVE